MSLRIRLRPRAPSSRVPRPREAPPRTRPAPGSGESRAASRHCGWRPAASPAEHRPLGAKQLVDALAGEIQKGVELWPREAVVLAGALHLDETVGLEHHDVG